MENGKPVFISLFSGCGGSSLGYKWAGFRELLAIDFNENAVETFRLNFPDIPCWQRDIREMTGKEIMEFCGIGKGELDLLDASPPCQGFSTAGKMKVNDKRNDLFMEFYRLVKELKPQVFVMENVAGMLRGKMRGRFIEITKKLRELPYRIKCKLMNTMYYGVPQSRPRLIWIGVIKDLKNEPCFPIPSNEILTVARAWEGHEFDDLEGTGLIPEWKKMIDFLYPGEDGNKAFQRYYKTRKKQRWFTHRRLSFNRPSNVILKQAGSAIIHPSENRRITINEMKLLHSYPLDFRFIGSYRMSQERIGESVPPRFMEAIAGTIKERILCHAPTN